MRKRSIALLLTGVLVGTLLFTPARAHFTENTKHLGRHAWQQFIRQRVFTRKAALARFPRRIEVHLPKRTTLVPAAGTPTENGQALKQALAAIPGASADDPWLLRLEPGVFDLDGETLELPLFIDLEGSGRDATTITCDCTSAANTIAGSGAVIFMHSPTELRSLSVVNNGPLSDPIRRGIDMRQWVGDGRVTDARVEVVGPTTDGTTSADGRAVGIWSNVTNSHLDEVVVDVNSEGALISHGIFANNGGSIDIRDSQVSVSTDTDLPSRAETFGILVDFTDITARDTSVDARSTLGVNADNAGVWNKNSEARYYNVRAYASDGFNNWAFYNESGSPNKPAIMQGIEALAIGGGDRYTAVENVDAGAEISGSRLVAQGPNNIASEATGLRNRFTSATTDDTLIHVTNSTITSKGSFLTEGIHNSSSGATGVAALALDNSSLVSQEFSGGVYQPSRWFRANGTATFATVIGGSRLSGDGVAIASGGATLSCAGVWDEFNTFFPSDCPDVP